MVSGLLKEKGMVYVWFFFEFMVRMVEVVECLLFFIYLFLCGIKLLFNKC